MTLTRPGAEATSVGSEPNCSRKTARIFAICSFTLLCLGKMDFRRFPQLFGRVLRKGRIDDVASAGFETRKVLQLVGGPQRRRELKVEMPGLDVQPLFGRG